MIELAKTNGKNGKKNGGALSAVFPSAIQFKCLLEAVQRMVDDANVFVSKQGLSIKMMDPSHVALVDLLVLSSIFEKYEVTAPIWFKVDLENLLKKCFVGVGPDERLTLAWKECKLTLAFKGGETGIRRFTVATLEPEREEIPQPKLVFNTKVRFVSSRLAKTVKQLREISDHIRFETTVEKFTLIAGAELMRGTIEFLRGNPDFLELENKVDSHANYNTTYLEAILEGAKGAADIISLEFSTNMPLKVSITEVEGVRLIYYLAPRIEAD